MSGNQPFVQDSDFTLWHGDALEVLRELPAESVHCVATSPPFYALRDYGVEGQIGLEDTPDEWCANLVAVFAECRRVLTSTGTLWVECGDSYDAGTRVDRQSRPQGKDHGYWENGEINRRIRGADTKAKDLIGSPWLLAFALRADGWWLRQAIIWHKPNAMPESVTDRCTTAHSYVFLLSKSARYHFDADAIAEPAAWERWGDQTTPKHNGTDTAAGWIPSRVRADFGYHRKRAGDPSDARNDRTGAQVDLAARPKNARSVWSIPTRGYPDAHFATWPEALAERIIKAGCPEGGTVLDPFGGSGTTALVARRHGRRSVLIELNESYCELAAKRLQQLSLLATTEPYESFVASQGGFVDGPHPADELSA